MRINKKDIISFDVDYIELFWTLKIYREIWKWIDNDNSHFREYKWYTLEYTWALRNYESKITFWKDNIPVFAWYLWAVLNEHIETKDYFVVYWSAFTLMTLEDIIDFIKENISIDYWSKRYIRDINKKIVNKRENTYILKRVDLKVDVIKPVWDVVKNFRKLTSKWSKFFDDKWNVQTYYIWEKKNTMNKNLLIRIYDKIADIKQKEKQFLHPHYLKEDYVTRIELEFRSELVKFLYLDQLLDREYTFWLFISYVQKHTPIFKKLVKWTPPRLDKLDKRITVSELHSSQLVKKRYKSTFLWYARKFLRLWSCPVHVLINEWIISSRTKTDIWISVKNWELDVHTYIDWVTTRNLGYLFANNEKKNEKGGT